MKRRNFLTGAGLAAGATTVASVLPRPAIAQDRLEWKMVTAWPKGLPGLGTGAERLAERITKASDGRLNVKVFAAGELVDATGCFDAVSQGQAEMGHDSSSYHIDKLPAAGFFGAMPSDTELQSLEVGDRPNLLAEPAAHLRAGVAGEECFHA